MKIIREVAINILEGKSSYIILNLNIPCFYVLLNIFLYVNEMFKYVH